LRKCKFAADYVDPKSEAEEKRLGECTSV